MCVCVCVVNLVAYSVAIAGCDSSAETRFIKNTQTRLPNYKYVCMYIYMSTTIELTENFDSSYVIGKSNSVLVRAAAKQAARQLNSIFHVSTHSSSSPISKLLLASSSLELIKNFSANALTSRAARYHLPFRVSTTHPSNTGRKLLLGLVWLYLI